MTIFDIWTEFAKTGDPRLYLQYKNRKKDQPNENHQSTRTHSTGV